MYTAYSILIILVVLSFCSYLIPAQYFGNRLYANMTVFLTLTTINITISQQLPASSYPTIAEKLITMCFVVCALAVPECILVFHITTRANSNGERDSTSPLFLQPLFRDFSKSPWRSTTKVWRTVKSGDYAIQVAFAIDMIFMGLMMFAVILTTVLIHIPVLID